MRLPAVATEATALSFKGGFTKSSAVARTHVSRENKQCVPDGLKFESPVGPAGFSGQVWKGAPTAVFSSEDRTRAISYVGPLLESIVTSFCFNK